MEKTDMNSWGRAEMYRFFSSVSNPYYMVTFRQDVTEIYNFAKSRGISFYYAMVYLVTKAVNSVEAFSYTIREGEVYRIDRRKPSFTDLKKGSDRFHIVTMPADGTIDGFCSAAAEKSSSQTEFICMEAESDELIYLSCLPWLDITGITNEHDMRGPYAADDCIPRVSWGKYTECDGRRVLGMSVEVNHKMIDGLHIGMFSEKLTELAKALNTTAEERIL